MTRMTLDEAIKHCEEVAYKNECKMTSDDGYTDVSMKRCAEEHRQLAEWLKELKHYKEQTYLGKRIEYGTDGNPYEMSITNGKEYEEGNIDADGN